MSAVSDLQRCMRVWSQAAYFRPIRHSLPRAAMMHLQAWTIAGTAPTTTDCHLRVILRNSNSKDTIVKGSPPLLPLRPLLANSSRSPRPIISPAFDNVQPFDSLSLHSPLLPHSEAIASPPLPTSLSLSLKTSLIGTAILHITCVPILRFLRFGMGTSARKFMDETDISRRRDLAEMITFRFCIHVKQL